MQKACRERFCKVNSLLEHCWTSASGELYWWYFQELWTHKSLSMDCSVQWILVPRAPGLCRPVERKYSSSCHPNLGTKSNNSSWRIFFSMLGKGKYRMPLSPFMDLLYSKGDISTATLQQWLLYERRNQAAEVRKPITGLMYVLCQTFSRLEGIEIHTLALKYVLFQCCTLPQEAQKDIEIHTFPPKCMPFLRAAVFPKTPKKGIKIHISQNAKTSYLPNIQITFLLNPLKPPTVLYHSKRPLKPHGFRPLSKPLKRHGFRPL